jgi:hypothetical protein
LPDQPRLASGCFGAAGSGEAQLRGQKERGFLAQDKPAFEPSSVLRRVVVSLVYGLDPSQRAFRPDEV